MNTWIVRYLQYCYNCSLLPIKWFLLFIRVTVLQCNGCYNMENWLIIRECHIWGWKHGSAPVVVIFDLRQSLLMVIEWNFVLFCHPISFLKIATATVSLNWCEQVNNAIFLITFAAHICNCKPLFRIKVTLYVIPEQRFIR